MTSRPNRDFRRELERELRATPAPAAPADLLARIRAEIPADLKAASSEEPAGSTRKSAWFSGLRIAASIALAVVGVALAFRTLGRDRAAEPATPVMQVEDGKGVRVETAPIGADDRAQDETEKPSSKGKTKETDEAAQAVEASPSREAQLRDDSERSAAGKSAAVDEVQAVSPAAPPSSELQAAAPAQERSDAEALRSLGYLGSAAPAPSESGVEGGAVGGVIAQVEAKPVAPTRRGSAPRVEPDPGNEERITIRAESPALDAVAKDRRRRAEAGEWQGQGQYVDADAFESIDKRAAAATAPSTGGSREPNERAAGDMFFRPTDANPFVDTAEDRLSTFGLDVDTGSWSLARSYFDRGAAPPPEAIRVEEFVNAQAYGDPAPRRGDFTLVAEGAPSPFAPGESYRLLRFAVKARELRAVDRKPANLTFVVDVSGSMGRENRLGLVKRSLELLLGELSGDDRVALVVYGTRGRAVLHHTRDLEAIREAIVSLRPEGSTNAEEGLRLGYELAAEAWRRDAVNRVILCSDGVANVGATGPESILARIGAEARRGIELTTVGFGMGNYNDALMEQLADQGDGAYHYVDTLEEARRIFVDELTGTLQSVAKDAKVQVEFDPRAVDRWRLLGYENRDVADRDFRNDGVDAGEIGVGHSAVALYEVRLRQGRRDGDRLGTLRLRWKSRATKSVEEAALELRVGDLDDSFRRASGELRTAAVAAELAERLKRSYWAKDGSWDDLRRAAERLESERGRNGRALADMVRRAARLTGDAGGGSEPVRPPDEREEY